MTILTNIVHPTYSQAVLFRLVLSSSSSPFSQFSQSSYFFTVKMTSQCYISLPELNGHTYSHSFSLEIEKFIVFNDLLPPPPPPPFEVSPV